MAKNCPKWVFLGLFWQFLTVFDHLILTLSRPLCDPIKQPLSLSTKYPSILVQLLYFSIYLSTAILCNFLSNQLLNVNFLVTVVRINDGLALRRWELVSGNVIWYLVSGWYLVLSVMNTNWPLWAVSLFGCSEKSGAFWLRLCSSDIYGSGRW
jgi:hypothetical protein